MQSDTSTDERMSATDFRQNGGKLLDPQSTAKVYKSTEGKHFNITTITTIKKDYAQSNNKTILSIDPRSLIIHMQNKIVQDFFTNLTLS